MGCTKETAGDWESLKKTVLELYGDKIRVKRRRAENSFSAVATAEGDILFKHTSMREVERFIRSPEFKRKLEVSQQSFGFSTGVFNGPDWS